MALDRIPAATKVKNALKYFEDHIPFPSCIKTQKLLQLANEYVMKDSGVPITWHNQEWDMVIVPRPVKEFDDSLFSDYEIDIMEIIARQYGNYDTERLSAINAIPKSKLLDTEFKRMAFESAYQSYLMGLG